LDKNDIDDLNLQHLEVRKIIKKNRGPLTTEFKLA
jgi:hypothetical protein